MTTTNRKQYLIKSRKTIGYTDLVLAGVTYGDQKLEPGTYEWENHFIPLIERAFDDVAGKKTSKE